MAETPTAMAGALAAAGAADEASPPRVRGLSDEELMSQAQAGSDAAFEALTHRHYRQVANFAARMTGRPDLAGDIAQHAFVATYDQRRRYRRGARFLPWFYTIVRRRCIKVMRVEARTISSHATEVADGADPRQIVEEQELANALRAALQHLPERERGAVVLYHYMQWPYDDIAGALGCKPGAARTAACRGRARLRELLSDFEEDLP